MLSEVEALLERCSSQAGKRQAAGRIERHLLSALVCLGRHTLTGHIATSGRQFNDWTADYRLYNRGRLDPQALFTPLRQTVVEHLPATAPAVVALDDTRAKKWSPKTPGTKYMRDPLGPPFQVNLQLAQRFFQVSMAWDSGQGPARLIPIDFQHAPFPKKPRPRAGQEEWERYRQACRETALSRVASQRLHALRQALDREGQEKRSLVSVVDGGYSNRTFLKNLPGRTTVIGRIRGDAKLYFLPAQQPENGRRRIYGSPAPTPEGLRCDPGAPWQSVRAFACGKFHNFKIKTLAPVRWRATGKEHDLRLMVIAPLSYRLRKGGKLLYRKPVYLLCTDTEMSLEKILQYYLWRWDIEVNFRDEKTVLGVGQAQVHHPCSVENVPALSVAAYALLLTAATKLYGIRQHHDLLPPPKWRKQKQTRASTQNLLQQLRHDLWGRAIHFSDFASPNHTFTKSQKLTPDLYSSLFYGASVT